MSFQRFMSMEGTGDEIGSNIYIFTYIANFRVIMYLSTGNTYEVETEHE